MAKLKNADVYTALLALNEIAKLTLPARGALRVRRLVRQLNELWEDVEAVRQMLLDRFAVRGTDGNPQHVLQGGQEVIQIQPEHEEAFQMAWREVLGQEVEVAQALEPEDFGSVELQPALLIALGDLVADG